jgi:hypothetical protein
VVRNRSGLAAHTRANIRFWWRLIKREIKGKEERRKGKGGKKEKKEKGKKEESFRIAKPWS